MPRNAGVCPGGLGRRSSGMPRRPGMPSCLGVPAFLRASASRHALVLWRPDIPRRPGAPVFWHAPRGTAPHAPGSSPAIGTPTQRPAPIGTDVPSTVSTTFATRSRTRSHRAALPQGSLDAGGGTTGPPCSGQWAVGSGQWAVAAERMVGGASPTVAAETSALGRSPHTGGGGHAPAVRTTRCDCR
jgi:hypothetical protein